MNTPSIDDMYAAGVHMGYSRSRRHPSVKQFLFGMKHRTDIIDLELTSKQLEEAGAFLQSVKNSGKKIIFVGTKPEVKKTLRELAEKVGMPWVTKRWIGGTITNFPQIRGRVESLEDLSQKRDTDSLTYRTKKELLMLNRKIDKLELNFGGLRDMKERPAAIVVVDTKKEHISVEEARKMQIPIVGIANTDTDVSIIDYPVIANDASLGSVTLLLESLVSALQ